MIINIRLAIFLLLAAFLTGVGAGLGLGYQLAGDQAVPSFGFNTPPDNAAAAAQPDQSVPLPATASSQNQPPLAAMLALGQWYQLEQWLDQQGQQLSASQQQALLAGLRLRMNKYDAVALRRVLRTYLSWFPDDVDALFLLSDLQQLEGLAESALETLFTILNGHFAAARIDQARAEAGRIINTIVSGLKNRGAAAELEAFWRHVSERNPRSDYYRFEWARSLAAIKRWQQARRVLAETGTSDVSQVTLDEFSAVLAEAEQGLQFTHSDDRLLAAVHNEYGSEYTLLVDTGANITSLSRQALRGLGAVPVGQKATVRTAGGVVETSVYQIDYMVVQGRPVQDVRVLLLQADLPGLDGLLGTDVLQRLNRVVDKL